MVDLVHELKACGEAERLAALEVTRRSGTCGPGSSN